MKCISVFFAATLTCFVAVSQPQEIWSSQFHISNDSPKFISSDQDDNIYVMGEVNETMLGTRIALVKYNAQGEELWHHIYQAEDPILSVTPRALAIDPFGNPITVSHIPINQTDILVAKYSPEGTLLWDYVWNYDEANGHDNAHYATTDAEGNIFVCGASINTSGQYSMLILKFSAGGELLLDIRKEWSPTGTNRALYLALDSEGNMLVTGRRHGQPSGFYVIYKQDSEGNTLWNDTYSETGGEGEQLVIDSDDHIYASARIGGLIALQAYNPDGDLLWRDIWQEEGMNQYIPRDMAMDEDNHIIVLGDGILPANASNRDWFLLKYNTDGERLWHTYFNGSGNGIDNAMNLAIVDGNEMLAYGDSREAFGVQTIPFPTLARFNVDGNELWRVHAPDLTSDIAGMTHLSNGTTIVSYGALFTGQGSNFITAAYGVSTDLSTQEYDKSLPKTSLYPNPTRNTLTLECDDRIEFVAVYTLLGQQIMHIRVDAHADVLDFTSLNTGLYLVEVSTQKRAQTFKIQKY